MNDPRTTIEKSSHAQCKHIICGKGFHHLKGVEENEESEALINSPLMDNGSTNLVN